jgi:hypothetical protein
LPFYVDQEVSVELMSWQGAYNGPLRPRPLPYERSNDPREIVVVPQKALESFNVLIQLSQSVVVDIHYVDKQAIEIVMQLHNFQSFAVGRQVGGGS